MLTIVSYFCIKRRGLFKLVVEMSSEVMVEEIRNEEIGEKNESVWKPGETIVGFCPDCAALGILSLARLHFSCGKCVDCHCQCEAEKRRENSTKIIAH
jgi:hypothetical protein